MLLISHNLVDYRLPMPITNLKVRSVRGFAYFLGGLRLISDISLSGIEILDADSTHQAEITIRSGLIGDWPVTPTKTFREDQCDVSYSGDEILIDINSVARFLLRGCKEIIVERASGSDDGEIRAYL